MRTNKKTKEVMMNVVAFGFLATLLSSVFGVIMTWSRFFSEYRLMILRLTNPGVSDFRLFWMEFTHTFPRIFVVILIIGLMCVVYDDKKVEGKVEA